jgi:hypothetical protein
MQDKPLTISETFLVRDLRLEGEEFLVVRREDCRLLVTSRVESW